MSQPSQPIEDSGALPHEGAPTSASEDPNTSTARQLLAAWDHVQTVPLPSSAAAGFSMADGFVVAQRLRQLRAARGERPVGWKIGFTNRSIWPRYGVYGPIWGPVYDTTAELLPGQRCELSLRGLSQPRLEPEVVFGFAKAPRAGMDLHELQGCLAWVAHGFEVVHTHYQGWKFTAADCNADFALHGRLRVGPRVPVQGWDSLASDLAALQVQLFCDGVLQDQGQGSNVLDGPLQALQVWVDAMAEHTPAWQVQPGEFVTTGTITDAQPLAPGQRWHTVLSGTRLAPLALHTLP
jgi:2-oxo-3-hexenedioate decarboxylase